MKRRQEIREPESTERSRQTPEWKVVQEVVSGQAMEEGRDEAIFLAENSFCRALGISLKIFPTPRGGERYISRHGCYVKEDS